MLDMSKRVLWRNIILIAILVGALLPLALIVYVLEATTAHRYEDAASAPSAPVAIIFGAGVGGDGTLSPMLADRVRAAVQLYQAGRVTKLLMTGDNSRTDYDEVTAMRRYAVERGVPGADITLDYAGF